jgi:hypothetical protein
LTTLQRRQWLALAALAGRLVQAGLCSRHHAAASTGGGLGGGARLPGRRAGAARRALQVSAALDVPTRAHGVWAERGGTLLAVARRPGDWLLRWRPEGEGGGKAIAWGWAEPDRAFNGHVIASPDGKTLYTTETNLETGQGLIGLRDAGTLEKTGEWPTHGMDPHELLLDGDGSLVVANGGIPALPETGRLKIHMNRMDASLVRLDTRNGALLGQWRLADKRLSLRHMAWGLAPAAGGPRALGIALQAEHDDIAAKIAAAPVLALFDGQKLRTCTAACRAGACRLWRRHRLGCGWFCGGLPARQRRGGVAIRWALDRFFPAAGSLRRRLSCYGGRSRHHTLGRRAAGRADARWHGPHGYAGAQERAAGQPLGADGGLESPSPGALHSFFHSSPSLER